MRTLLVATDFSPAADAAAKYALQMACHCKLNLILVHVYSPVVPMIAEGTVLDQGQLYDLADKSSLDRLTALSNELSLAASRFLGPDFQPDIRLSPMIGIPSAAIKSLLENSTVDIVVMGIKPGERFSGILPGSTIRSLVRSSKVPILLIPQTFPALRPRQIAFASNFTDGDAQVITVLARIARDFGSGLLIFHNLRASEKGRGFMAREKQFLDNIASSVDYPKIFYQRRYKHTLTEAVAVLERNNDMDLLAIKHHAHHPIGEFFGADRVLRMISGTRIPLFVFPYGFATSAPDMPFTTGQHAD
ncbi:MAG: universal stress protein [Sphingobacteriales bacterium]|nr:MAG: universal stress protein [Sphingobacteriales bacterium]